MKVAPSSSTITTEGGCIVSSGALCKHLVHAGEVLLETGRGGRGGRGERGGAYREHVQDSDSCPCCEVQARENCRCLKVSGSLWPTAADTGVEYHNVVRNDKHSTLSYSELDSKARPISLLLAHLLYVFPQLRGRD